MYKPDLCNAIKSRMAVAAVRSIFELTDDGVLRLAATRQGCGELVVDDSQIAEMAIEATDVEHFLSLLDQAGARHQDLWNHKHGAGE